MSENSHNFSENLSEKNRSLLSGSGISFSQIPRNLFKLRHLEKLTYAEAFIALELFDWCHEKRSFPTFSISYSELARKAFCSQRMSIIAIQKLIDLNVLFVDLGRGGKNEYRWNIQFLETGRAGYAELSHVHVKSLHMSCENSAHVHVKVLHTIYIEFILDYIYIFYKQYFSHHDRKIAWRIPSPKTKKGEPQGSGSTIYLTRREAWERAISEVALASIEKNPNKNIFAPIYLVLMGGFNIEGVRHPKSYLKKIINDPTKIYESKKKSGFSEFLEDDSSFGEYIQRHNERRTH